MSFSWLSLEKQLLRCSLSDDRKEYILGRLYELENTENEFEELEIQMLIEEVIENQFDPIINGLNYNQTDIKEHLKKLK